MFYYNNRATNGCTTIEQCKNITWLYIELFLYSYIALSFNVKTFINLTKVIIEELWDTN
jgi:hypothetical protein